MGEGCLTKRKELQRREIFTAVRLERQGYYSTNVLKCKGVDWINLSPHPRPLSQSWERGEG